MRPAGSCANGPAPCAWTRTKPTKRQGEAVRYTGRVDGETLTLVVVRPNPPRPPNPLTAGLGKSPRLRKCN